MKIVGLDLSMNSSGCVSWDVDNMEKTFKFRCFTDTRKYESINVLSTRFVSDFSRYGKTNWFLERIMEFCHGADAIAVEDYSLGSIGKIFDIAEYCGQIKFALFNAGFSLCTIPPSVHKKYLTGNGRADKVKTTDVALEKFPFLKLNKELMSLKEYESPQNDVMDAISLAFTLQDKLKMMQDESFRNNLNTEQLEVMKSSSHKNKVEFWKRGLLKK